MTILGPGRQIHCPGHVSRWGAGSVGGGILALVPGGRHVDVEERRWGGTEPGGGGRGNRCHACASSGIHRSCAKGGKECSEQLEAIARSA